MIRKDRQLDNLIQEVGPLGYDGELCFYKPSSMQTIQSVPLMNHSKRALIGLASENFWRKHFTSGTKLYWDAAISACIEICKQKGFFYLKEVRGCGAWTDKGKIIFHLGDRIISDNEEIKVGDFKSENSYEQRKQIKCDLTQTLSNEDRTIISNIYDSFDWEYPVFAKAMLGYTAYGPVCGGIRWRSHIWLCASKGSGKTTFLNKVLIPLMGDLVYPVEGMTTASGIMQGLKTDALPVVFDEADTKTEKDVAKMQEVIALMRQSSTESSMKTVKGSANHKAITFHTRSCFLISSTSYSPKHDVDHSRISLLTLKPLNKLTGEELRQRNKRWRELRQKIDKAITPELGNRWITNSIKELPNIRANAEKFSDYFADYFADARAGDQAGHLAAGAYAIDVGGLIESEDQLLGYVNRYNWTPLIDNSEESQEEDLLQEILQLKIWINGIKRYELSIGEALTKTEDPEWMTIQTKLNEAGIRIISDKFFIANKCTFLKLELRSSSCGGTNWGKILKRMPYAEIREPEHFCASLGTQRSTGFPLAILKEKNIQA